ncbi:hypothetical protein KKB71_03315 [Patescibacteria group bacterium]|nr:hypothetical protein [Patescibacteria group bacterium]MBU2218899.1 hypothetical protein [Patescibacteria group bacterium]MBU2263389.1 hypothetical protein [Patescibacteria group bacterium]
MEQYFIQNPWIILALALWVLPWKGVALWRSARNAQKWWFIILLIANTLAILDIIYIFYFSKKKEEKVETINQIS